MRRQHTEDDDVAGLEVCGQDAGPTLGGKLVGRLVVGELAAGHPALVDLAHGLDQVGEWVGALDDERAGRPSPEPRRARSRW